MPVVNAARLIVAVVAVVVGALLGGVLGGWTGIPVGTVIVPLLVIAGTNLRRQRQHPKPTRAPR